MASLSSALGSPKYNPANYNQATLGQYLARRLVEIGVKDIFTVPGDSNLSLLDYLIAEPGLNNIGCCNELNAGYAADGYARHRGVGACVVTFTVGGLSLINAVAGAYSENLPVICVVGGPHSDYYASHKIIHHTIGLPDRSQELRCFQTVTCYQAVVNRLEDAQEQIDTAISTSLKESLPVYVSISCNLAGSSHPTFSLKPIPLSISPRLSNKLGVEAAAEAAATFLNKAVKPVLIGGPKLRVAKAGDAFLEFANASAYPLAVMPSAKGLLVPENHPHFIGTYWGSISSPFCRETVESADAYIFVGPVFSDGTTVGHSLLLNKDKAIIVQPDRVVIGNGPAFGCVLMKDFLQELTKRIKKNNTAFENYDRIFVPAGIPHKSRPKPLRANILFYYIQKMLSSQTVVIAETGDSLFNCQNLKLPQNCGYEVQLLYSSIGWSIGATLGYAQSAPEKRVIACIGDGSFQMTAQDVSTMIRNGQKNIIFLINNGGYTMEVGIHDGPYNVIKNWNYTTLVDAFCNGDGNCWTAKVRTEEELIKAIEVATGEKKDYLCFLEVFAHRCDTSRELLQFGFNTTSSSKSLIEAWP
ncbi:OLC1v1025896C1 [Oldenlandia corymbosa var. corymbosa]|uniref:pyruvate decarboxylase n=1 Tax=Oldenlandia corymbosa var. corymbosa TaxID=529605 RepID=A0AAV1C858_OLDCO|nr:OLC1v1025896C1 [Oldenlandia corymbosa var. corymbosa]